MTMKSGMIPQGSGEQNLLELRLVPTTIVFTTATLASSVSKNTFLQLLQLRYGTA